MRIPKEYQPFYKLAREQGWSVHMTGGGHIAWINPDGRRTFTANSPGHGRKSLLTVQRELRKAGLNFD